MSEDAINRALGAIGNKDRLAGDGASHTASTLLREHGWNRDCVEAQLAHKKVGVAEVYNQAIYLEPRREIM